jgi:hypothetical protein
VILMKDRGAAHQGIEFTPWGIAIVKAVVLAKFMLLGEAVEIGGRTTTGPLIWPTLRKAFGLLKLLIILTIIEEAVVGLFSPPLDRRLTRRSLWPSPRGDVRRLPRHAGGADPVSRLPRPRRDINSAIKTPLPQVPTVNSDVGAFQLLGHLNAVPFMGSAEVRDGPFGLLGDVLHVPVGTNITTRDIFFQGGNAALTPTWAPRCSYTRPSISPFRNWMLSRLGIFDRTDVEQPAAAHGQCVAHRHCRHFPVLNAEVDDQLGKVVRVQMGGAHNVSIASK